MDFGWKFHLGNASNPKDDFGYGTEAIFAKAGDGAGAIRPSLRIARGGQSIYLTIGLLSSHLLISKIMMLLIMVTNQSEDNSRKPQLAGIEKL